jgi:hypothetical protein
MALTDRWARAAQCTRFKIEIRIQTRSNDFKFSSNFDSFKTCHPVLKKLEIKYGWKELERRNNCPHRNFSRFEIKFELKFKSDDFN